MHLSKSFSVAPVVLGQSCVCDACPSAIETVCIKSNCATPYQSTQKPKPLHYATRTVRYLKPPATQLLFQQFVQTKIRENIKVIHLQPFVRGTTRDLAKGLQRRKHFHIVTSSWRWHKSWEMVQGVVSLTFFARNSNTMENSPCQDSVAGHQSATNFCTCHGSTAVVPCTKFGINHGIKVEVRVKRNFHRIWIAMEKQTPVTGEIP